MRDTFGRAFIRVSQCHTKLCVLREQNQYLNVDKINWTARTYLKGSWQKDSLADQNTNNLKVHRLVSLSEGNGQHHCECGSSLFIE